MGPCEQLKRMFAETRLIATTIVLVSIQIAQFYEVTVFRVMWANFSFAKKTKRFQTTVVHKNQQLVKQLQMKSYILAFKVFIDLLL